MCIKPLTLVNGMTVPCGYCVNCRVNRTSQWKLRLVYELENWNDACFVTLTFSDEYLGDNNLEKKELQDYFKRLRKSLQTEYGEHEKIDKYGDICVRSDGMPIMLPNKPIKYFAVGEYGSKTKRKHYHAIIFGLSPYVDKERKLIADSWLPRCEEWQFDRSRGPRSAIGTVTNDSIAYVAGYVQKKLVGQLARDEYHGRQPPFQLSSQRLGLDFAEKNRDRLALTHGSYLNGSRIPIPRYFRDKLDIEPQLFAKNSSTARFKADMARLESAYRKSTGAEIDGIDPTDYVRRFTLWYDNYLLRYADAVLKDFEQRSKLRDIGV